MLCSIKMFEESERLHPVQEEETIKVEKIRGHIVFIGTEDDTLWNAAKYIRRMDERLKTHAHSCTYDVCVRPYGTHFCFPESMLKMMLPFGKNSRWAASSAPQSSTQGNASKQERTLTP